MVLYQNPVYQDTNSKKVFVPDELNQEEVEQVQNICRDQGIVPVSNLPNEDLRLTELKRLDIMEKDLGGDPRYSSLTEVAS